MFWWEWRGKRRTTRYPLKLGLWPYNQHQPEPITEINATAVEVQRQCEHHQWWSFVSLQFWKLGSSISGPSLDLLSKMEVKLVPVSLMLSLIHGHVLPSAPPVVASATWEPMKSKLSCCVQIASASRWSDSYTIPIRQVMFFYPSCAKLNLIYYLWFLMNMNIFTDGIISNIQSAECFSSSGI